MPCPALQYFNTLTHKREDFWTTAFEFEICVVTFSATSVESIPHYMKN
jgi:hypothetical protein